MQIFRNQITANAAWEQREAEQEEVGGQGAGGGAEAAAVAGAAGERIPQRSQEVSCALWAVASRLAALFKEADAA